MNTVDNLMVRQIDVIERLGNRLRHLRSSDAERAAPIVTLTYAQSIDGCIAPIGGGTLQLSNCHTQKLTHQIRAIHDAILVGINTVLCDDPRLTVRLTTGANPQPVVVDSRLRFPLDANLLRDPCVRPIIATGPDACANKAAQLAKAGARVIRVPVQGDGLIDLSRLFPTLKQMGYESVMVEGGARVITNVLASQMADHLLVAIAPRLVGGMRAVHPMQMPHSMPQLHDVHYQPMSGDVVVWGRLESANGHALPQPAADARRQSEG
ncbi:MAG: RibD family protein [Planctomycetales bacterium]|nr:RibD family protein [Planctomycetales bacterium]